MKKLILMLMLCAPMSLFAQKFGHLDSQALLQSLPEATKVKSMRNNLPTCKQNCNAKQKNTIRQRVR